MVSLIGVYRKICQSVLFLLFISGQVLSGQNLEGGVVSFERKTFTVVRTSLVPKIDGYADDAVWAEAQPVTDFIMYTPFSGVKSKFNTEVRVVYNDNALFVCAQMFDPNPDSIFTELGKRDAENLNADFFSVQISSFDDGINGETFKVSASNVQSDSKERGESEDFHEQGGEWDAVWESKTRVTDEGWICEMKIPFSALRFSTKSNQVWGINFWREVRRVREVSSWNYVDKSTGTKINHLGQMMGMSDVEPPLRLSLVPYLSGYIEKVSDEKRYGTTYNGGLDLKVGLNESFTLDATLIPDFGQVQSDDHILNLTPYETQYNENRSFFTEGTELFSRGNIFYSRRVGGSPHLSESVYGNKEESEIIVENPSEITLINAAKISGRSQRGLGIGVFNGLTNPMYAHLRDTVTGEKRTINTEPLTNYNMFVLDQSLKNNSYISLANTNVWRAAKKDENFYTANVTSMQALLQTKSRLYSISGITSLSQKYYKDINTDIGKSYSFSAGKTGGAFRVEYEMDLITDNYDPNDMGYLDKNNEFEQEVEISYNTFEPKGHFMSTRVWLGYENSRLYSPSTFVGEAIEAGFFVVFMNYWSLNYQVSFIPRGENDYFEPRTTDFSKFYHSPEKLSMSLSYDTDMSKSLYLNGHFSYNKKQSDLSQYSYCFYLAPIIKISDRLSMSLSYHQSYQNNDIGFVDKTVIDSDVVFGKRDIRTSESTISGSYSFSSLSGLTLRYRHYWSRAAYDGNYFLLNDDGSLSDTAYPGTQDKNTNYMNIDMVYSWRFAPGSELSVVWKNSIEGNASEIDNNVFRNFNDMLDFPQTNSISLKILYYLDYQNIRRVLSSK